MVKTIRSSSGNSRYIKHTQNVGSPCRADGSRLNPRTVAEIDIACRRYIISSSIETRWIQWLGHLIARHSSLPLSRACTSGMSRWVPCALGTYNLADDQTGTLRITPSTTSQHDDSISAIQWMPDGSEFIVASMDCKLIFYVSRRLLELWLMSRVQQVQSVELGHSTHFK